jgi:RNA polymerase sigma-70 factor (ECF subfamily)
MLTEQSDGKLVERLLAGRDQAAFEVVVHRHGPMVYRVCWRVLQQAEDAEDAFQATFLLLARKLRTVQKRGSLASWLHGVAHRVALDSRKQIMRRCRRERRVQVEQAGPPDEMSWKELRTVLDTELATLPEKLQSPLILCYLESRSQDEAARQLGWSKRTLLRRLEEARAALGRRLARRGVIAPAALGAILISDCVAPAALPSTLVRSTVEAGMYASVGSITPGLVSANSLALAKGVMKAMFISKIKFIGAIVIAGGAVTSGSVVLLGDKLSGGPAVDSTPNAVSTVPPGTADRSTAGDAAVIHLAWRADSSAVLTISTTFELVEQEPPKPLGANVRKLVEEEPPKAPTKAFRSHMDVRLWDSKTAKLLKDSKTAALLKTVGEVTNNGLSAIAVSPDKKHAAIAGANTVVGRGPSESFVKLFDAQTWAIVHELRDDDAFGVDRLAFSPDGKTLALGGSHRSAEDGSFVKLWDLEADIVTSPTKFAAKGLGLGNAVLTPYKPPAWAVTHLAFSPDGTLLASAEYGQLSHRARIRLRDAATGEPKREWELGDSNGLASIAFADGGKSLVTACGTVKFWDAQTGDELRALESQGWECHYIAVSHDGRHVAADGFRKDGDGWISKALLWDATTGKLEKTFGWQVPGMFTSELAFSPDGRSLAIGGQTSPDPRVEGSEKVKGELKLISLD